MKRRTFLGLSALGLVAAAGGGLLAMRLGKHDASQADANARSVLHGAIPALLAGVLPLETKQQQAAREAALERTMTAIAGLPPATRAELDQLFWLLASRPGRWLAGVDWESATPESVATFLSRWRASSIDLFVVGYQALHDLVLGSWYADPSAWDAISYPGPTKLP